MGCASSRAVPTQGQQHRGAPPTPSHHIQFASAPLAAPTASAPPEPASPPALSSHLTSEEPSVAPSAPPAGAPALAVMVDSTGDGKIDSVLVDTSGDGRPDTMLPLATNTVAATPVPAAIDENMLVRYTELQQIMATHALAGSALESAKGELVDLEASQAVLVADNPGTPEESAFRDRQLAQVSLAINAQTTVVEACAVKAADLDAARDEAQGILVSVFEGEYGSPLEQQLEAKEEEQGAFLEQVTVCKALWGKANDAITTGGGLLQAALDGTHQVSAASISTEAAVEVQTKISGGYRVLSAIWTHLPGMRLPYFGGEHMNVLHTMMHRIHHDIKSNHLRELQTALADITVRTKWCQGYILKVITERILGDFDKASLELAQTRDKLNAERTRLMAEAIKTKFPDVDTAKVASPAAADTSLADAAAAAAAKERAEMMAKLDEIQQKLANTEKKLETREATELPTAEQLGLLNKGVLMKAEEAKKKADAEVGAARQQQYAAMKARMAARKKQRVSLKQKSLEENPLPTVITVIPAVGAAAPSAE